MLLTLSECLPPLRCVATGTAVDTQEAIVINTSAVNLGLGSVVICSLAGFVSEERLHVLVIDQCNDLHARKRGL